MEKKRKTLLLNCLLFVVLVSSLLVLASCDQPGSVVDSSSQDKTTPEEDREYQVYVFDGIQVVHSNPDDSEEDHEYQIYVFDGIQVVHSDDSEETASSKDIIFLAPEFMQGESVSEEVIQALVEEESENHVQAYVDVDSSEDYYVYVIVSVDEPHNAEVNIGNSIEEIELIPASDAVDYTGSLDIRAQVSPNDADLKDLKWSLKYADGSEVGENDGVSLIDNGDGTCTLVHKKVSSGFDVVVTAYTDEVSASCTIECREGGHGVLDIATDVFIEEETKVTLPNTLLIPWQETAELKATVSLTGEYSGDEPVLYVWHGVGGDLESLESGLSPFSNVGKLTAKYKIYDPTYIYVDVILKSGKTLTSNKCYITTQ